MAWHALVYILLFIVFVLFVMDIWCQVTYSLQCIVLVFKYCVAVEVIIQHFKIPEEVAAVTLVSFGSASPEILLNTVSVVTDSSALSLPAALGSAMIAFGLIPPLCILFTPHKELSLQMWPIIREVCIYCSIY